MGKGREGKKIHVTNDEITIPYPILSLSLSDMHVSNPFGIVETLFLPAYLPAYLPPSF
jgi:hypothetical protein